MFDQYAHYPPTTPPPPVTSYYDPTIVGPSCGPVYESLLVNEHGTPPSPADCGASQVELDRQGVSCSGDRARARARHHGSEGYPGSGASTSASASGIARQSESGPIIRRGHRPQISFNPHLPLPPPLPHPSSSALTFPSGSTSTPASNRASGSQPVQLPPIQSFPVAHPHLSPRDHLYLSSPITANEYEYSPKDQSGGVQPYRHQDVALTTTVPLGSTSASGSGSGSAEQGTPGMISDRTDSIVLPPRKMMDMNMAAEGSMAAQPGIHTPLAAYAAQTVTWLWFGTPQPPSSSSNLMSSPNPFASPQSPTTTLNPLQVTPSVQFTEFVAKMLQITMVSHSVTLIALLYIHRLKQRNPIKAEPGSEQRPFVASLILGNKYLDDNTYTNQTWSELAGLPLAEINRMEAEFLRGLDYKLGVQVEEYNQWRVLLDGFILARQREAVEMTSHLSHPHPYRREIVPSDLPPIFSHTALQPPIHLPFPGVRGRSRARSTSPQTWSPPTLPAPQFFPPSPPLSRKRSAIDAFSSDVNQSAIYESLRQPSRRAGNANGFAGGTLEYTIPMPTPMRQPSGGLGRSSSLNRRIARMPDSSRRGSFGHAYSTSAGTLEGMDISREDSTSHTISYPVSTFESPINPPPPPMSAVPALSGSEVPATPDYHQFYGSTSSLNTPEMPDLRHAVAIGNATNAYHAQLQAAEAPAAVSASAGSVNVGLAGLHLGRVPSHEDMMMSQLHTGLPDRAMGEGWNSLVAPYERTQPDFIPPEHLMFYTLAADAHPGQDGAPRKAILRYQQPLPPPIIPQGYSLPSGMAPAHPATSAAPTYTFGDQAFNPYTYPAQPQAAHPTVPSQLQSYTFPTQVPGSAVDLSHAPHGVHQVAATPGQVSQGHMGPAPMDGAAYPGAQQYFPPPQEMFGSAVYPEPAQFANAGPPGYVYDPTRTDPNFAYRFGGQVPFPAPAGSGGSGSSLGLHLDYGADPGLGHQSLSHPSASAIPAHLNGRASISVSGMHGMQDGEFGVGYEDDGEGGMQGVEEGTQGIQLHGRHHHPSLSQSHAHALEYRSRSEWNSPIGGVPVPRNGMEWR